MTREVGAEKSGVYIVNFLIILSTVGMSVLLRYVYRQALQAIPFGFGNRQVGHWPSFQFTHPDLGGVSAKTRGANPGNAPRKMVPRQATKKTHAFSLIELLTVIGIIAFISVASVPVVGNMAVGRGCSNGAAMIEQAFEYARAEAMSKQTYVYVLIDSFPEQGAAPLNHGQGNVAVFVAASKDGSSVTPSESNCNTVGRLTSTGGVGLDTVDNTSGRMARPSSGVVALESKYMTPYPLSGNSRYIFQSAIEFSPSGTARIAGKTELPSFIEIGLKPAKGDRILENAKDVAVVQLSGITGKTTVYRP